MADIKTFNKIAREGLNLISENGFTLNQTGNPEGIILRSQNLHDLTFHSDLIGIARAGAGVNNIPIQKCSENGIVVFNTPGANANAVSELVIASMIVAVRNMASANAWVLSQTGEDLANQIEKGKKQFQGTEIKGKTLGIIGLGSIGHLVANTAIELGMTVYGYDPYIKKDPLDKLDRHVKRVDHLEELYEKADFLTIHVPSTPTNRHIINGEAFNKMKEQSILLNFSRDELVDRDALLEALDANKIRYYVTDFPTEDLIKREDTLVFPHLGASTKEAEEICALMASKQLVDFIQTGNIKNAVNFPDVEMDFETDTRLAIVNRNIPNMINLLVDEIGKHQINIIHFMNKSRGEYAYTLIDLDEDDPDLLNELVQNVYRDDNILSARLIYNQIF